MSILFYKQRHRNPNFKDTAGANYAHIRYIATRPRVMKNEAGSHGLFGKLEPGTLTEFEDWKEVAKKVYANSKKGMIAGLTLAVMIQKVYVRESEKGFALVPYLSIGCLLAMLL